MVDYIKIIWIILLFVYFLYLDSQINDYKLYWLHFFFVSPPQYRIWSLMSGLLQYATKLFLHLQSKIGSMDTTALKHSSN